jgi:predicted ABC-type ATPase
VSINLLLDRRPIIVALAGPNGAGKTTFYRAHIRPAGLRFVNADVITRELSLDPYSAMKLADSLRRELVNQRESFVFETVFSDPVGEKISFLRETAANGYTVLLCFIGISSPQVSQERVAMRVLQGGHDVPTDKLLTRYSRTLANLKTAIEDLPHVWIFDNDDLDTAFRLVAVYERGQTLELHQPIPSWLRAALPK